MNDLTVGLLGALLATNQPLAVSNLVQQQTGVSIAIVNPNDPVEKELLQLMEADDAALAEVDRWIQTNNALAATGAGETKEALNQRIHARFGVVRTKYEDFLLRHPNSARGFLAYGTFLDDTGDEEVGKVQLENSRQLDPNNPKCSEDSAYPAAPDSEYGWEKLFSERLYLAYMRNRGIQVRIARFHNIFGPEGTWRGGREKAPAAMCRKVAETPITARSARSSGGRPAGRCAKAWKKPSRQVEKGSARPLQ